MFHIVIFPKLKKYKSHFWLAGHINTSGRPFGLLGWRMLNPLN
jgi:hypothetical protein